MSDELDPKELDLIASLPSVKGANAAAVEAAGIPTHSSQVAAPPPPALDLAALDREQELQDKYGNSSLTTFAETAAGEASFGLTDRLAHAVGLTTEEAQQERAKRNPGSQTAGEVTGIVAPALLSGGESLLAKGASLGTRAIEAAAKKAEQATAKMVGTAIAESGSKSVAKQVIKKSIEKGVGGAVEGALYSAGHLAHEDAIGTADFNAENLLSSVGTGALYGGMVGAAMPGISAAASASKDTAKALFGKAVAKYVDPRKAAEELSGLGASKLAKLESTGGGQRILDDLPAFYRDDVKIAPMDSAEQVVEKVKKTKAEAGTAISDILQQADSQAAQTLGSPATNPAMRAELLGGVADKIEQKFLEPIRGDKVFRAEARQVQNLVDDVRRYAAKPEAISAQELVTMKRKMDAISARAFERAPGAKLSRLEKAAFDARKALNDASYQWVTAIDPSLAENLRKANRTFELASTVEMPLLRKSLKDHSFVGFKDALYGLGGAALGHAGPAAALVAGKKFMESDLRRRLVIIGGLEKAQAKVASDISTSVADFLKKGARPAKLASITALTNSALAQKREEGKAPVPPKNRKEAYRNAAQNISHLVVNNDQLMERGVKAGAVLSHAAPQTAAAVGQKAISAVNFLQSKIPKNPYEAVFPSGKTRQYEPSSLELAKFERYVQVVDNPLSVLQDLKQGTLTREHVEALRAVYPDLYTRIQQQVLSELQHKSETDIPYSKRVQVGLLLDVPVDESLIGKNIAGLQATFTQAPLQGGPPPAQAPAETTTKGAEFTSADRAAGQNEAFMRRRSEP